MASTTTRLITVEEFEQMPEPEQPGKQELLNGELTQLPPAKQPHSTTTRAFYELFRTVIDVSRIFIEAGYQMPTHNWLAPDVSVTWPDQAVLNEYFQGAPMIAVEVVSPGNSAEEIQAKITAYLSHGAAEIWIMYPRSRTMMVYTPTDIAKVTDSYPSKTIDVVVRLSEVL